MEERLDVIFRTLGWLFFLVLFIYTPILENLLVKDSNFITFYYQLEKGAGSLFVNIGLLCMVSIDYFSVKPYIDKRICTYLFVGVLSAFIVYVHSGIMYDNRAEEYVALINNNVISLLFHLILLYVVGYLKFKANYKECPIIEVTKVN